MVEEDSQPVVVVLHLDRLLSRDHIQAAVEGKLLAVVGGIPVECTHTNTL